MATSFAAYASQYLNRQQQAGSASLSSSHPMFFSFSTDDGSRGGHGNNTDLDDLDDPHLHESNASTAIYDGHDQDEQDDDDPYLRLDEDERTGRHGFESRVQQQTSPLIAADENASVSSDSPKGWLAHLAASPSLHRTRSPSPARTSSSDSIPPADLFLPTGPISHSPRSHQTPHLQPPVPPRTIRVEPPSLSLTESLLPRDGRSRPLDVFSLPDPRHVLRGRRKFNDSTWTAVWLAGVTICVFFSILLLFVAHQPDSRIPRSVLPYTTLLHTVPMLTILTFVSAIMAYVHIFLLRIFVRPVMIATSIFIPVTLLVSAIWAFVGSFMWDGNTVPTWGETVGLRLFAIIPLALSVYTARRLLHLPQQIHTTSSTLTLVTHLLISNPFLLALSPAILLVALLVSLPFLTLIFRLLLIGYATPPILRESKGWEWHVYGWANWAIAGAVGIWLWTWGVARGTLRMTTASVIGAWYFADPTLPPPPPASTHTIHSGLFRATGPSLGTTVLSALLLTLIRLLTLFTLLLQRLPFYLPPQVVVVVLPALKMAVGYLEGVTTALSQYALIYAGLTGDPFFPSARRARALTVGTETRTSRTHRAATRSSRRYGKEPPLTLLTISPLTLTFPFALMTYLFVAHTLGAPNQALGAAILAGGVTALVGLFCVGLVRDTADTLYVCYCIDKDVGEKRREEVFIIFEPDTPSAHPRQQRDSRNRRTDPEEIVPLSPVSPSSGQWQPQPSNQTAQKVLPPPVRHLQKQPAQQQPQAVFVPPQLQRAQLPLQPQVQFEHKRIPSHGSSRSQFTPSTSGQPRSTPLAPPPPLIDDDPDPFKQSFVDEEEGHEIDIQPTHTKKESLGERGGIGFVSSSSRSTTGFNSPGRSTFSPRHASFSPSTSAGAKRMQTSAELNMKSHVFDSSRRSISSSGSGAGGSRSFRQFDADGDVEQGLSMMTSGRTDIEGQDKGADESDLFPGSGFFN